MLFLGTGAAEMRPNPFCGCTACRAGIQVRDESRRRSALLVDARTMIDFGPDVPAAAQQWGTTLADVRTVFITHTHWDHFALSTLDILGMTDRMQVDVMRFYLSPAAHKFMLSQIDALAQLGVKKAQKLLQSGVIELCALEPYAAPRRVGMWRVQAVLSNHTAHGEGERAMNYLLQQKNNSLLYVSDSGLYDERNLLFLKGARVDALIMEGTWGDMDVSRESTHLNAAHFVENLEMMRKYALIDDHTRIYMTHINSKHSFNQETYQRWVDVNAPQEVIVAHDGLYT